MREEEWKMRSAFLICENDPRTFSERKRKYIQISKLLFYVLHWLTGTLVHTYKYLFQNSPVLGEKSFTPGHTVHIFLHHTLFSPSVALKLWTTERVTAHTHGQHSHYSFSKCFTTDLKVRWGEQNISQLGLKALYSSQCSYQAAKYPKKTFSSEFYMRMNAFYVFWSKLLIRVGKNVFIRFKVKLLAGWCACNQTFRWKQRQALASIISYQN